MLNMLHVKMIPENGIFRSVLVKDFILTVDIMVIWYLIYNVIYLLGVYSGFNFKIIFENLQKKTKKKKITNPKTNDKLIFMKNRFTDYSNEIVPCMLLCFWRVQGSDIFIQLHMKYFI